MKGVRFPSPAPTNIMPKFIHPEFFDIFGIIAFAFIVLVAAWSLKAREVVPNWALIVLLVIGILGLIVDSAIVYLTYIKKK